MKTPEGRQNVCFTHCYNTRINYVVKLWANPLQSDTKSECLHVYSQNTLIILNTNLIVKPPGNSSSNNTSNSTSASLLAVKEEERGQTGNQTTRSRQEVLKRAQTHLFISKVHKNILNMNNTNALEDHHVLIPWKATTTFTLAIWFPIYIFNLWTHLK